VLRLVGQPTFIEYFELATRPHGTDLLSAMNGLFQAGGVIGTLCLPWVADKWGRKAALALVSLCGSILLATANFVTVS
jgi:MFS family permease